jgi:hypothetical protein
MASSKIQYIVHQNKKRLLLMDSESTARDDALHIMWVPFYRLHADGKISCLFLSIDAAHPHAERMLADAWNNNTHKSSVNL